MATTRGKPTRGGARPRRIAIGGIAAVVLLALLGSESLTETGIILAVVGAAAVGTVVAVLVAARVVVPSAVWCCRRLADAYRRVTPDSAAGRLVGLALVAFVAVGGLFVAVGLLAV
jgi:hypothetical protein